MPIPLAPSRARLALPLSICALAASSGAALAGGEILLIPNSGTDKVWAVSAIDGAIISENFIPNTEGMLQQPIQAIPSGTGTILVTDELRKSVFEFGANGAYIRTLASPKQGVAGAYSLCVRDGFVYFTSGSGVSTSAGYVYKVALSGGPVTVFSDWTTVGAPRGIQPFGKGFLVGNSLDDDLEIVGADGVVAAVPFHNSDGALGIDFPQQIKKLEEGQFIGSSWLVSGFTDPSGLYLYSDTGLSNGYYAPATSPRGCHPLPNGDILFTGGTQIRKIDIASGNSVILYNGNSSHSFRFIDVYTPPAPCAADVNGSGTVDASDLAVVLAAWGTANATADIDGSGLVDASDLAVVLAAWGPC
ncbi:MAG: hypothetical protein RLY21_1125 [Planctomycetota bacterium]|jgi:hypothetical protein